MPFAMLRLTFVSVWTLSLRLNVGPPVGKAWIQVVHVNDDFSIGDILKDEEFEVQVITSEDNISSPTVDKPHAALSPSQQQTLTYGALTFWTSGLSFGTGTSSMMTTLRMPIYTCYRKLNLVVLSPYLDSLGSCS